jgi:hypothetical protein
MFVKFVPGSLIGLGAAVIGSDLGHRVYDISPALDLQRPDCQPSSTPATSRRGPLDISFDNSSVALGNENWVALCGRTASRTLDLRTIIYTCEDRSSS